MNTAGWLAEKDGCPSISWEIVGFVSKRRKSFDLTSRLFLGCITLPAQFDLPKVGETVGFGLATFGTIDCQGALFFYRSEIGVGRQSLRERTRT